MVYCDLLADPGGVGRPTGFSTGVTGCAPLPPETEVPVSVFKDQGGLEVYDGVKCLDEREEDMAAV